MSVAAVSAVPEPGALASVRDRRWVVVDVARSTQAPDPLATHDHGPQPLVRLAPVEDDGDEREALLVWELEPGARTIEQTELPAFDPERVDDPRRLDAFLDAIR